MHCTKFPCRSKNVRAALGAELGASSITQAKQIINLSLLNHFYPVVSYRRVKKKKKKEKEKESDELLYTARSLVTVRN